MQKLREMFPARDPRVVSIGHLAPGWSGGRTAGIDPFLPFKIDLMTGRKRHEETLPDFVHLAARATPRGSDYSRRTGSASPIDVTIRRPRERPFGAPLGGKAITFPTPPAICVYRLVSRDLARAMTAALGRKGSESLTDVKEMENRKPWRHKKVLWTQ